MYNLKLLLIVLSSILIISCNDNGINKISSPHSTITLNYNNGIFSVSHKNAIEPVFEIQDYGIITDELSSSLLTLTHVSKIKRVEEKYDMISGKRKHCFNEANEVTFHFNDSNNYPINIIFRIFDDGIAFKYELSGKNKKQINDEETIFKFDTKVKRWTQKYNIGYEGTYDLSHGENYGEWSFPALFEVKDSLFVLLTEAGIRREHCGSKLKNTIENESSYQIDLIGLPMQINSDWSSVWRIAMIGSLSDIVESTLVTDVSEPSIIEDSKWVEPGIVSWIYWANNRGSKDYRIVKEYIDFASEMNLPYVLIDWEWDEMTNGGNLNDAIKYSYEKNIKPLIWYNSSTAYMVSGPLYRLNTSETREKEYKWLNDIGVKGVKIDFFPDDTNSTINYYLDLVEDAIEHKLLVNFHGSTIPRGWQRTYPNLMSYEAVYGAEWYNNGPFLTNIASRHNTTLPFTRNVIGSMDYTPCAFSNSQHPHITTNAHELALTVVFESALQHLADRPSSFLEQPKEVRDFLSTLPSVWDDTKLISGYPGSSVVIARKKADNWYLGALNGLDKKQSLKLDLSFIKDNNDYTAKLFTDSGSGNSFSIKDIQVKEIPDLIECLPHGGFVIEFKKKD